MDLDTLEEILKKLALARDSDFCHGLQTRNFPLFLVLCSLGNMAEVALKGIDDMRKRQDSP